MSCRASRRARPPRDTSAAARFARPATIAPERRAAARTRPAPSAAPATAVSTEAAITTEDAAAAVELLARAHELLEQAQAQGALALAREAIELDPSNTDAHLVAAFAHADVGHLDEAMAQAQLVLKSYPLTAGARYILGIINQQRGDIDAALVEFKRTVYIDRDFVLAHFAMANIYRARGETSRRRAASTRTRCERCTTNPTASGRRFWADFGPTYWQGRASAV